MRAVQPCGPDGSRASKIWGSEHDHGFVLFIFATTGFHIARSGIFLDPNIRVIRGPYCTEKFPGGATPPGPSLATSLPLQCLEISGLSLTCVH